MKNLYILLVLSFVSSQTLAHSGGTDSNGCHAGSQPYHCHNGGSSNSSGLGSTGVDAWDINLGYKWSIDGQSPIPYFGLSLGQEYGIDDVTFGVDLGFEFSSGFYLGYVTTSNSIQLGFNSIHLSINQNSIGLGLRLPLNNQTNQPLKSMFYLSGSGLVGDGEEEL